MAALGTTDQHSLLQLTFLFNHKFDKFSHLARAATKKSLNHSKLSTYRFAIPKSMYGRSVRFFFFFETACAFAEELYGVDAFDQTGVEEAEKLLRASL